MALFYVPDSEVGMEYFSLGEEESNHCIRVLRKKEGDTIEVLNGMGFSFEATIQLANPKKCVVKNVKHTFQQPYGEVHIAIALTKQMERMEWLVEKGTELGCTHFSFIETHRSERNKVNLERLTKIAVSAMKQSKRLYLPHLDALVPLSTFLRQYPGGWVAHCLEQEPRGDVTGSKPKRILIGPEGDFTVDEIRLMQAAGYAAISLGEARLRTETAGLKAIFLLGQITSQR
ncbi:MAG: RsmE family RNA methyltransferase [Flavobacteriales bacterium]|jgi:16S rRNA (uracil1498-N3)-methyltransferase